MMNRVLLASLLLAGFLCSAHAQIAINIPGVVSIGVDSEGVSVDVGDAARNTTEAAPSPKPESGEAIAVGLPGVFNVAVSPEGTNQKAGGGRKLRSILAA